VRVGTLATTDYADASFDLVYMSHVLEHLPDPVFALRRCRQLLVPGGRLVLVYPNPEALTARIHGHHSCVFEPPRHLVLPPARALRQLLRTAGFTAARVGTLARHAALYFAASRAVREGRRWDWARPAAPSATDRAFAAAEGLLVRAGVAAGEEVVARAQVPPA
jgi:SAM-dependent methyltransferase